MAGSHLGFFSQLIQNGCHNSPEGASDPKIPSKPLEDISLKIQSLIYLVTQSKKLEKRHFPDVGAKSAPPGADRVKLWNMAMKLKQ